MGIKEEFLMEGMCTLYHIILEEHKARFCAMIQHPTLSQQTHGLHLMQVLE